MDQSGHLVKFTRLFLIHAPPLLLSVDFLSSLFPQVCAALVEWDSLKNVSNLVAKRQIYTCASYGEGCSLEKPNDCLRAAQQCLSRWWSTCHVCSIPFCLSAHLPSSHFLSSFTLPSSSISEPSRLPHSFLSLALSLSVFLFSAYLPQLPWICAFYNHSHCSPQSEPIYLLHLPLRIFFSVSVHHPSFALPFFFTHILNWKSAHTHTHQWTELWSGFVYDRERQYQDCFRVVSSHEVYRCQEHVLYVWVLGWSHFGKQKISYPMTSSGIKVNYQL